jgi:hypothetical protein
MSRDTAVQCFIEIVRGDLEAPDETIPFCMHALRFPEVREEVKRLVGDPPDPRRMNYVSHVLQAYGPTEPNLRLARPQQDAR